MKEMEARLGQDEELATAYAAAHRAYLADRAALAEEKGSAFRRSRASPPAGMPNRVKCLHVLAAHSLAAGPGVNPLGDEVLALLWAAWWEAGPCV